MTPDELRALAAVMRDVGIFKVTLPDGVTIELSQHAIQAGQDEARARVAAEMAARDAETTPAPAPDAEAAPKPPADDGWDYAATEGEPG